MTQVVSDQVGATTQAVADHKAELDAAAEREYQEVLARVVAGEDVHPSIISDACESTRRTIWSFQADLGPRLAERARLEAIEQLPALRSEAKSLRGEISALVKEFAPVLRAHRAKVEPMEIDLATLERQIRASAKAAGEKPDPVVEQAKADLVARMQTVAKQRDEIRQDLEHKQAEQVAFEYKITEKRDDGTERIALRRTGGRRPHEMSAGAALSSVKFALANCPPGANGHEALQQMLADVEARCAPLRQREAELSNEVDRLQDQLADYE